MDARTFAKMAAPLGRAVQNMISRGTVRLADSGKKMQSLQVGLLEGETADNVEHFEAFGFTSCPSGGAEALVVFPGGDRSHGIAIVVGDRKYRLKGLASGDAAVYDERGQHIILTAEGIVVNAVKYTINAPTEINGTLSVSEGITGAAGIVTAGDATIGGKSFLSHTNGGEPVD